MADITLPHILVVDDDPAIRDVTTEYLGSNDFRVSAVANGAEMAAALRDGAVDLIILDLRMPGEDGIQIAGRIREKSSLPILILSGRLEEADRVMALELGADDYMTKPFSCRELLARVRALLRRSRNTQVATGRQANARGYRFAGWELNINTRRLVSPAGHTVGLTNGEFSLLAAFLASPG